MHDICRELSIILHSSLIVAHNYRTIIFKLACIIVPAAFETCLDRRATLILSRVTVGLGLFLSQPLIILKRQSSTVLQSFSIASSVPVSMCNWIPMNFHLARQSHISSSTSFMLLILRTSASDSTVQTSHDIMTLSILLQDAHLQCHMLFA